MSGLYSGVNATEGQEVLKNTDDILTWNHSRSMLAEQ